MTRPCHGPDDVEHQAAFAFVCRDCGREEPLVFWCSAARARWAESHAELTGHTRWLLEDLPRPEISTTLAMTPLGVTVPEGHLLAMVLGGDRYDQFHCSCGVSVSEASR